MISSVANYETFTKVVQHYVYFLQSICEKIDGNTTNAETNRRKFDTTKRELFDYLVKHKKYFQVFSFHYEFKSGDRIYCPINFNYSGTFEQFLRLDNFIKHYKAHEKRFKLQNKINITVTVKYYVSEICRRIENAFGKTYITNEDLKKFFETRYLVHNKVLKTKFTNYKDLASYIKTRNDNYLVSKVSPERIDQMSLVFKGSFKDLNVEKTCPVCKDDYEKGQKICRFSCNHYCCRKCTEGMFAIPQNGSDTNYRCPLCREDCT